jgi:hypothetical protein
MIGAPRQWLDLKAPAEDFASGLKDLEALRSHIASDTVTSNYGYAHGVARKS